MVELGISTFGETTELEGTGQTYSHAERIRQLVTEIELADKVGLDVYGIGEHHREDFAAFCQAWTRFGCFNSMPLSMLCQMDVQRLWLEGALSRNPSLCLAMI